MSDYSCKECGAPVYVSEPAEGCEAQPVRTCEHKGTIALAMVVTCTGESSLED